MRWKTFAFAFYETEIKPIRKKFTEWRDSFLKNICIKLSQSAKLKSAYPSVFPHRARWKSFKIFMRFPFFFREPVKR